MKRILGFVIAFMLLVFPITSSALSASDEKIDLTKYKTMNFKEILAEEQIAEGFKNYNETDDQINIYLFRGNGCGYCKKFLQFLNDNAEEYGKYFKVVGFEIWYDSENADLMKKISSFMGESASGVPFIIIGDKTFPGYASEFDEGIKEAITSLYESKDRYDVFEEYNNELTKLKKAQNAGSTGVIIWNLVFVAIATTIIMVYINKTNKEILDKISEIKFASKEVKKEESKPAKTTAKKTTKKSNAKKK